MPDTQRCPHHGECSAAPARGRDEADQGGLSALRAISINHWNVGVASWQATAVGCDRAMALHHALSDTGLESLVLATCNRTEIYWRAGGPGDVETVWAVYGRIVGAGPQSAASAAPLAGQAAARHLFRVCAGLESLVLGEAEILGQVRAALEACTGAGPFLQGVAQAALRAGRRARAETAIGVGALSVASAAVQRLGETVALPASRVVVVGAGDTGLKAARHLRALGVGHLVVANRTVARAESVAAAVGAEAIGLDGLAAALDGADAVICAVEGPRPVIRIGDLRRAAAARGGRPPVVVDLSTPPAIEAGDLPGLARIDLVALEHQVAGQRERRAAEIPNVEQVIARELVRLEAWAYRHALRPFATDLRRKVEAIRRAELARAQHELPHEPHHVEVLERLSRRLLEQVLAIPLATLESGKLPLDAAQAQYLRRLFALDPGASSWP